MEINTSLIFKKKNKKDYMFTHITKKEDDPETIYIFADNDSREMFLYFDMKTLKELYLLISEFLLTGEEIYIPKRIQNYEMHGPKVEVENISIDMCDDKVQAYFADSLNAEDVGPIFIIENKRNQKITLLPNIKQCKEISKTLRRFIFGYELMHKSHKKRSLKAATA